MIIIIIMITIHIHAQVEVPCCAAQRNCIHKNIIIIIIIKIKNHSPTAKLYTTKPD